MTKTDKEIIFNDKAETSVEYAVRLLSDYGITLTEKGRLRLREWMREFSFEEVMAAIEIAFDNYDDGTKQGMYLMYKMIPHICASRARGKKDPALYWKNYLKKALRTNFNDVDEVLMKRLMDNVIFTEADFEYAKLILKMSVSWNDFVEICIERMG